ncbi:hypothetical protein GCM10009092_06000 [Bowmanella denitrificans]|uniref:DUF2845 domain-containing protein n=1 Tax=Bowmanella denitrificans TaxID=366582 RepID=A0ABN0WQS2_9ALTE|nr:DUF2845 domain-containing protein [Bowmanella denitrificans]
MERKSNSKALALVCFLLSGTPAKADSFRCNQKLVMEGDTTLEVKQKCGGPDEEETVGYVKIDDAYINVVRYMYDPGEGRFLKILEFHNGVLNKIITGPRS